ncbi:glycosyltransferase [Serinibacter arcticus]|uniref:Glycosyltransferase subfamily 4-like N-terminal domain-containing protein n=1 Tax=Serinibacter arcticus TaxID=1655435 RepID=A0A4Z1E0L2_9MICO|nr:glycosyltransferase [Serinibacter arcticus]TGO04880.1 hypothetical protein SERN_2473 [Serinibacter arcticus]
MTEQLLPENVQTWAQAPLPTAPPEPTPAGRLTIASVPAGHPYVRGISGADDGVVRLRDPLPDPADPDRWWPPVVLDAAWITQNADVVDVVHVHFGAESLPPGRLAGALDALDAAGLPLVYTAHDLTNPQLADQAPHEADLDLLISRASAVITLTDGAADEIARRWDRTAVVIPHPAIVAEGATPPPGRATGAFTVGVHLRDIRPGIDAVGSVRTLLAGLTDLRAAGVAAAGRVVVNDRVRDSDALDAVAALLTDRPDCVLVRRPRVADPELEQEVADLDVALLPYRHGTHSGWVELCHDLGVPVVGPRVGYAHEQHPDEFTAFEPDDGVSLARAVLAALARGTRPGSGERAALVQRRALARVVQHRAIVRAHTDVYRTVVRRTGASA